MAWSIQLSTGEYLEAVPELSFENNNMVFSTSDNTILPGSYSFPFDIPLTPRNRVLLGNPHLITNSGAWAEFPDVTISVYGEALFMGKLTIRDCNPQTAKVNINSNPLQDLKAIPLNQIDMGGARTFPDAAALLAHAKDTADNPLDYDCIFFPVFNPKYINEFTGDRRCLYQNFFETLGQEFVVDDAYPALMPFARLDYVLERIFANIDYQFENRFQTNDELRLLTVYNNKSIWTDDGLPTSYNLQDHLSDTASTAFVRKLMGGFCQGLFINPFSRRISMVPLQNVIQRPAQHDWTHYAIGSLSITNNEQVPEIFQWAEDSADSIYEMLSKLTKPAPAAVDGEVDSPGLFAASPGIYWVTDRQQYFKKKLAGPVKFLWGSTGKMPAETGSPIFEADLAPLIEYQPTYNAYAAHLVTQMAIMPYCFIPGTVQYKNADDETVEQQQAMPDRLMLYRGFYDSLNASQYPMANGLPYDRHGNKIGDYSLHWDGDYGMYNTWWRHWHTMLYQGKHGTQLLALPVSVLKQYNFDEKVRIGQMDFLIKKLNVQRLLGAGLIQVEASIVSTV